MAAIECPNCGSPISELQPDRRRRCAHCRTMFTPPGETPVAPAPGVPAPQPGPGMQSASFSSSTIVVNGRTYSSLDEMPPEARAAYQQMMGVFADKDGNGVPDILEGAASMRQVAEQLRQSTTVGGATTFTVTPRAQAVAERKSQQRGCITLVIIAAATLIILGATAGVWLPLLLQ